MAAEFPQKEFIGLLAAGGLSEKSCAYFIFGYLGRKKICDLRY
jgi:hypothetical protein